MINPNTLKKDEMLKRWNFRCKHRHNGWDHPSCYDRASGQGERIGFLDIEASNLKADFGCILSWCIKDENTIHSDVITKKDIKNGMYKGQFQPDRRIVLSCMDKIWNYERVVGHYSTFFDCPYIRTRAMIMGIQNKFPKWMEVYHTDVWRMAKRCLCISRRSQEAIARAILKENIKTRIHPEIWLEVQMKQSRKGLDYILDHNKKDVIQLEQNFNKLRPFVNLTKSSI